MFVENNFYKNVCKYVGNNISLHNYSDLESFRWGFDRKTDFIAARGSKSSPIETPENCTPRPHLHT